MHRRRRLFEAEDEGVPEGVLEGVPEGRAEAGQGPEGQEVGVGEVEGSPSHPLRSPGPAVF